MEKIIRRYVSAVVRFHKLFITGAVVLFILAGFLASQLTVDSSMENLLPEENEVIQASAEMENEFGGQEDLIIAVHGDDEQVKEFMDTLASELVEEELVDNVFYKMDMSAFEQHAHLYIPTEIYEGIEEEVNDPDSFLAQFLDEQDVSTVSALFIDRLSDFPEDEREKLLEQYAALFVPDSQSLMSSEAEEFMANIMFGPVDMNDLEQDSEYLVSDNGELYLMMIRPNISMDTFMEDRETFFPALQGTLDEMLSKPEYSGVEAGVTGGYLIQDYEADAVALDSFLSTAILTFTVIMTMIIIAFRRIVVPLSTGMPLLLGVLLTAAFAVVVYGSINIFSIAFAALLLGIGTDGSIHILSRYSEERTYGKNVEEALVTTLHKTGSAMIAGSLTTACAFIAFVTADMQAFTQMGVISAVGIGFAILCMLLIVPAILAWADNKEQNKPFKNVEFSFLRPVGRLTNRFGWIPVALVVLMMAITWTKVSDTEISGDMGALYPEDIPSITWLEVVQEEFEFDANAVSLMAEDMTELEEWTAGLGEMETVHAVESVLDYLPEDQDYKLEVLEKLFAAGSSAEVEERSSHTDSQELFDVSESLDPQLLTAVAGDISGQFSQVAQEAEEIGVPRSAASMVKIDELAAELSSENPIPALQAFVEKAEGLALLFDSSETIGTERMDLEDLPADIRSSYVGETGMLLISVSPQGDIWDEQTMETFQNEISEQLTGKMSGMPVLMNEVIRLVQQDVIKVSIISVGIIFAMLLLAFRSMKLAFLTMISVIAALFLTLGLRPLFNFDVTILNIMGMPLIIGLGVGNAVHLTQRIRTSGIERLTEAVVHTGKAVMMSTLTTLVGFGSLIFANHPGMEGLGKMIVLGLGVCLVLILTLLPSLFSLFMQRRQPAEK